MRNEFDNNAINPNVKNKTNTFNLIIGIATLLIAILGATFAYFSATARSKDNDVTVKSAYVSISYDGGTEIKATNLIPATQQVALKKYEKEVAAAEGPVDEETKKNYDDYKNDIDRRCVDANGKEVCYVYQFSVISDGEEGAMTQILPTLKVNSNAFDNLSYVLYEVEFVMNPDNPEQPLTDKYGFGLIKNRTVISQFTNMDTNSDNINYVGIGFNKFEKPVDVFGDNQELVGVKYPVACLYKNVDDYENQPIDSTARCESMSISNVVKHTYQLVIWLEETGEVQNEQGMTFQGTVTIEVSGGSDNSEYENGKVTGKE